ncbi:MAG: FtsW/RodA/SpoVE family cell cycle protein [Oscillospiraceae bacterium]|nr:FtsW/RodA/SpoVE family cell cycle protein [Oscillospiraceae bacterium]
MRSFVKRMTEAFRKGDLVLLLLCVVATAFGCLIIASATTYTDYGSLRYVGIQLIAALAGIFCYLLISSIDTDFFPEHRRGLVLFNIFLLALLIPFGVTRNGNRSWLDFPFLPFNIQPAEICKITFILILASVMASHQNNLSSPISVGHMVGHLLLLFVVNYLISRDMGVSLIFAFIFVGMTLSGGVSMFWFISAAGAAVLAFPILWNVVLQEHQKERIAVLFDPSLDPYGTGAMYHSIRAMRSLTGGGLIGQGLFNGNRTQAGALFAQHTDYIFAVIGEEMGFIGCVAVLVLMAAIVIRCVWVGIRSRDFLRRLVCFGAASALIFQVFINVGMCIGVAPVIGLTLPFISYGGSSTITLYAMLGLVSGVYARPEPTSQERYIRPPLQYHGGYDL